MAYLYGGGPENNFERYARRAGRFAQYVYPIARVGKTAVDIWRGASASSKGASASSGSKLSRRTGIASTKRRRVNYDGPRGFSSLNYKEMKFNYAQFGQQVTDGFPMFTLLNGTAIGNGNGFRSSDAIEMKHLVCRLFVSPSNTHSVARALLVFDKFPNGAAPTINNLLEFAAAGTSMTSGYRQDYRDRFEILSDVVVSMGTTSSAEPNGSGQLIDVSCNVNRHTHYIGDQSPIANLGSGSLYLVVMDCFSANGFGCYGSFMLFYKE